jgi:hypothetical protein
MALDSRAWHERNHNRLRFAGGGIRGGLGIPDAADEAADGGICIPENVSGMRVDYATSQGDLPGVWKGTAECWGRWSGINRPGVR